ncbi:hypothetical protein ACFFQW_48150 [Umezawaea endophytica]|uniref:Uncharacterized protein n=1 Tax=Umezawaea endophytica TaxID=1654476 RepID=A0A9X3A5D2_9PSEU|nr:hypothetical protein [Umezawaea endophytica]MCS7483674.1 hypothetical protein [Umezawaea endophytica]
MSDRTELEALIRTQIEEPAGHRILAMVSSGIMDRSDADLFSTSAERYKAAVLAEYDTFDPRVRDELRKSLLADYQHEIDRLIGEISARSAVFSSKTTPLGESEQAEPALSPTTEFPSRSGQNTSVVSSLLGALRRYFPPKNPRPPQ